MPFLSPYDLTDAIRIALSEHLPRTLDRLSGKPEFTGEFTAGQFRTIEWAQEGPDPHKVGLEIDGKHFTLTLTAGKPKL